MESLEKTLGEAGYRPSPDGVHRGRSSADYRLVRRGDEWTIVAPRLPRASRSALYIGGALVVSAPWFLGGVLPGFPLWLRWVGVGVLCFGLVMSFGLQFLASRRAPALVVRTEGISFPRTQQAAIPRQGLIGLELVRYGLRGQNVVSVGLRQLVADFGPDASPRYVQIPLVAVNIDVLAQQLADVLGVPLRVRDLGTLQGRNFVCY